MNGPVGGARTWLIPRGALPNPRRRSGDTGAARSLGLVATLTVALAGGLVGAGAPAAATDVCPSLIMPEDLPDELRALPVQEGASVSQVEPTLAALREAGLPRQVPEELPPGVEEAWVWQFGYLPMEPPPTEPAPYKPGGPVTYTSRYEAWVCLRAKVPDVTGLPIEEALGAVRARGLDPEAAGIDGLDLDVAKEEGWEVVALQPSADPLLPFGDLVVVTFGATGPESSTRAPSTGSSSAATREDTAGGGTPDGDVIGADGSTRDDRGAAGTGDVGRLVTDQAPWSWAVLLTLLAAVAAVAGGLRRRAHRRRHEPQVITRVRDDLPHTELTELRGLGRTHSLRIQTHRDVEEATLQTVVPTDPGHEGPPVPDEQDRG